MSQLKVLVYCFLMCVASGCITYWALNTQNKKIAVVDAVRLFDQFDLKKELEAQEKTRLLKMSKQVDSVANNLQIIQATKNEEEIKKASYEYSYIKQKFQDAYTQSNKDINEQIWKRLNAYIEQYGKDQKLHVILGANGMGSILYNDDYYDLTNDAIKYANKKYEEGN